MKSGRVEHGRALATSVGSHGGRPCAMEVQCSTRTGSRTSSTRPRPRSQPRSQLPRARPDQEASCQGPGCQGPDQEGADQEGTRLPGHHRPKAFRCSTMMCQIGFALNTPRICRASSQRTWVHTPRVSGRPGTPSLIAMASTPEPTASNLPAMTFTVIAMTSTLEAMASNLLLHLCPGPCDGFR